MKKFTLILLAVLILPLEGEAQTSPEALLSQLPAVPIIDCAAEREEIDRFSDRIHKVKEALQQEVERIHADANKSIRKSKLESDAIRRTGLQAKDVQQLQISNGSNIDGSKAAEKIISKQYGIDLHEIESVATMSDAEQEQWAKQYADLMKKKASKNPQSTIPKDDNAKMLFELASEQKKIGEYITEKMSRIALLLRQVDRQDSIENKNLEDKLIPLRKQLCSGICSDAEVARSKAAEKKIYDAQIEFCQMMSPRLTNTLEQYLITVKSLLPVYRKLTNVENKIAELQQIGNITPNELSCYAAIDDYTNALLNAYKYWVGKFNK